MDKQKTIKKEIIIKGYRLSDGKKTYVKFHPQYAGGLFVKFKENILPLTPKIINISETRYLNSIIIDKEVVTMVEHIFSAVNGLGIDNLIVEFGSNEAPFFADSIDIAYELKKNIIDLNSTKEFFKIKKPIKIFGKDGQYCEITPSNDFIVDITVDFNNIIGKQRYLYSFKHSDYIKDVSFARSILIFEIKKGKDAWIDSKRHFKEFPKLLSKNPKKSPFIAYNSTEYITPLRDSLEPVKHKLLDFIGDLIFIGKIPKGRFKIYKPGHSFNRKIVKYLMANKSKI